MVYRTGCLKLARRASVQARESIRGSVAHVRSYIVRCRSVVMVQMIKLFLYTSRRTSSYHKLCKTIVMALRHSVVLSIVCLTAAFPIHFPPMAFTNSTSLDSTTVPSLVDPKAALAWDNTKSPSILLCNGPNFAGECRLLEKNAARTCLNLDNGRRDQTMGLEVGSLKVGGGAECVLFE